MTRARHYESAVARVEEIIRRLDSGEAGLRETLELVKEGRELVEYCAAELEAVSRDSRSSGSRNWSPGWSGAGSASARRPLTRHVNILLRRGHIRPARRPPARGRRLHAGGPARRRSRAGSSGSAPSSICTGGGVEGIGEDVVYDAVDHVALQEAGPVHDLAGRYALGEFCELIDSLDLFPVAPQRDVSRLYRRWTFHSAALDLALRQAGKPLHEVLGRAAAAAHVRRLAAARRAADAASRSNAASRATRRFASSSTRRAPGRPS